MEIGENIFVIFDFELQTEPAKQRTAETAVKLLACSRAISKDKSCYYMAMAIAKYKIYFRKKFRSCDDRL